MESTLWMLGVYKSVVSALELITGATPAGAPDGYSALQTRSQAHSVSDPLLELPAATTWDQGMRANRKEMLAPPLRRLCHRSHCPRSLAVGIASPRVQKSSRRLCLGKCPAAQWPDDEKALVLLQPTLAALTPRYEAEGF
ncbi:hypothetical protein AK812_SmicGene22754 [Symbiodinium microadriaticum]|uniref:Uncharacterized protein n=1 Tax=Symbiodinium microadriaticum TaxID=2951 RepID=A0A1Q9DIZ3_SYMMI|nr:hypothetical protein AK812_SmicGene22754 [Symbiodinium microadriaticum]